MLCVRTHFINFIFVQNTYWSQGDSSPPGCLLGQLTQSHIMIVHACNVDLADRDLVLDERQVGREDGE
jgi:hypothetical protein